MAKKSDFQMTQEIYDEIFETGKKEGITNTLRIYAELHNIPANTMSYKFYSFRKGKTEDQEGAKSDKRYTEDEIRIAKQMLSEKRSNADIAERLERTEAAVTNLIYRLKREERKLKEPQVRETRTPVNEWLEKNGMFKGQDLDLDCSTMINSRLEESVDTIAKQHDDAVYEKGIEAIDFERQQGVSLPEGANMISKIYDKLIDNTGTVSNFILKTGMEIRVPVSIRIENNEMIITVQ